MSKHVWKERIVRIKEFGTKKETGNINYTVNVKEDQNLYTFKKKRMSKPWSETSLELSSPAP